MNRGYGMAPTPKQMERMREVATTEQEEERVSQVAVEIPGDIFGGIPVDTPIDLKAEISQIIRSLHWKHQKQIFDIVQAAIGANQAHWVVVRKLIMDVSTTQVEMTSQVVGTRIRQHQMENGNVGLRFEPRSDDGASENGPDSVEADTGTAANAGTATSD